MSHNDNIPQRSARRHMPAILAIIAALVLAGIALVVFGALGGDDPAEGNLAPATGGAAATSNPAAPATSAPAPAN